MRSLRLAAVLLGALAGFGAAARAEDGVVLRFIPQADLRILDPIWTTAYITRNHGYMVFDTLFGTDAHFQPQPEMVDRWEVSADQLVYTFILRDRLKFSDGQPVRAADCIASLDRWMQRDVVGEMLARALDKMSAVDDKTFQIALKQPFPLLIAALGKPSIAELEPLRYTGNMAINHLQPPFNNAKLRQAVLRGVDQAAYMAAVAGDTRFAAPCYSVYGCGVPMTSEAGSEVLKPPRDLDAARRLVAEAGYKGETAVVLDATDYGAAHIFALVTADLLKKLGVTVDLQAMDWGTVLTRRTKKDPIEKKGWSLFFGSIAGVDAMDPAVNFQLRGSGEKAWFGWPTDAKIEQLHDEWVFAADDAVRRRLAAEIQEEAFQSVPYVPLGQFAIPTAYRSISGVVPAPVVVMWNVAKN
jgi:ABC-type transport system substrate-binding protein